MSLDNFIELLTELRKAGVSASAEVLAYDSEEKTDVMVRGVLYSHDVILIQTSEN
jgi:hypothetical protein